MSQHDLTIANQGFPAFRADLNDALQALGSLQSGTTAPSPTFANQLWYDTTNHIVKLRNEDNDAWISIISVDQATDSLVELPVADGGTGASTASAARANLLALGYTLVTGSAIIPSGTTAQRDGSPAAGYFRFNSDTGKAEIYNGSAWGSVGGGATGAGGDEVFVENTTTVTTNYTLSTGKNAMSVGAITINSGKTVTVPSGQRWVIL